jgi:predicted phosphodiesterase
MHFGALGDIHADFESVRRIMRRHAEIRFWLCVGDVGDDAGVYEDPPAPLYWIKGNNEDFDVVSELSASSFPALAEPHPRSLSLAGPASPDSAPPARSGRRRWPNLVYIPNGVEVEIDDLRVAGVGGTHAPTWYDKKASELIKKGQDDKRRHFVRQEVEAVKSMRGLDILLTHEAPRPFRAPAGHDAGKTPINEMIASAKPRLHLFGHHHKFVEMTVSGVRSVCLDLVSRSYLLIDRETLGYERRETV